MKDFDFDNFLNSDGTLTLYAARILFDHALTDPYINIRISSMETNSEAFNRLYEKHLFKGLNLNVLLQSYVCSEED